MVPYGAISQNSAEVAILPAGSLYGALFAFYFHFTEKWLHCPRQSN
jgi:hypothetical protein